MDNENYRWVIVAAGGLLGCVAMGAMFALPVFLSPMAETTGWSRIGISSAMTIAFLAMSVGSLGWGALADRFGPRLIVLAGSLLLALGIVLVSRATTLIVFQLVFGIGVGLACSAIMSPMMAAVTGWFDTGRSLAVSLVSAGMGMAPLTMSPLAGWLISHYDWRTAFLLIAAVVAGIMVPVALLVRPPPALAASGPAIAADSDSEENMTVAQAFRSPQFIVLVLTNFCCCATHSGPIFHTVSYAELCGISAMAAVSIYSLEGLAGMGGRIAFGVLGDRFGAKPTLVTGLFIQALGALGYFFVRDIGGFYAVAIVFGFTYAGVMPLYAVLIRENFPLRMMGTIIGASMMAGSLGMATGPVIGGWIYDTYGTYGWLYLVSFGLGLGACLMASLFKPRAQPPVSLSLQAG